MIGNYDFNSDFLLMGATYKVKPAIACPFLSLFGSAVSVFTM
jgi:hypothetical protein